VEGHYQRENLQGTHGFLECGFRYKQHTKLAQAKDLTPHYLPIQRGMEQHRFWNTRNYLNWTFCSYILMMCISTLKTQLLLVFIDMLDKSLILEDKIVIQIILENIPCSIHLLS